MSIQTAARLVREYRIRWIKLLTEELSTTPVHGWEDDAVLEDILQVRRKGPDGVGIHPEELEPGDYVAIFDPLEVGSFHEGTVVEAAPGLDTERGSRFRVGFNGGMVVEFNPNHMTVLLLSRPPRPLPNKVGTILRVTQYEGVERDIPVALTDRGWGEGEEWLGMNGLGLQDVALDPEGIEDWEVIFEPPEPSLTHYDRVLRELFPFWPPSEYSAFPQFHTIGIVD